MEVTREDNTKYFHLAGIVPVAGQSLDFDQPWPDCMMPIAPDFSLLEAAVAECAWAGCDTIWIICNDNIAALIKKKIGDFVGDPVWAYRKFDKYPNESKRQIPVYYVPVHPKDRDKRDCLAWSVLHGSLTAFKVSDELSKWVIPNKYYVSFPYGYFPAYQLREYRKIISSSKNVYITSDDKSMKDNYYCSFSFGKDEFIEFRRIIRSGTGRWRPGVDYKEYDALPIEERWSARFFELEQVFEPFDTDRAQKIPVENFYNIGSWKQYKLFMSENLDNEIKRPSKTILLNQAYKPIGKNYLEGDAEET
tara:strand:- start:1808 stop:2725 length:918 start_codon:yes stop_codon:yes gene_type:complete